MHTKRTVLKRIESVQETAGHETRLGDLLRGVETLAGVTVVRHPHPESIPKACGGKE